MHDFGAPADPGQTVLAPRISSSQAVCKYLGGRSREKELVIRKLYDMSLQQGQLTTVVRPTVTSVILGTMALMSEIKLSEEAFVQIEIVPIELEERHSMRGSPAIFSG